MARISFCLCPLISSIVCTQGTKHVSFEEEEDNVSYEEEEDTCVCTQGTKHVSYEEEEDKCVI